MTGPQLGREAIVNAATRLFAERGVDNVSLGEIHRMSGHRNRSATTYHFGGKEELIKALITMTVEAHDQTRCDRLDALDAMGDEPSLRQVLEAGVAPMVDDLADRQTRLRLRMLTNIVTDARYMAVTQDLMRSLPGLGRSTAYLLDRLSHIPEPLRQERIVLATTFGLQAFADQARLMDSDEPNRPPLDARRFAAHVVVLLEGLLTAPLP